MLILSVVMLFSGIFTEYIAAKLLITDRVMISLIMHLIGIFLILVSFKLLLSKYFKERARSFYLFTFLLCFFVPIFGLVIALLMVFSLYSSHAKFRKSYESIDELINLKEIEPVYAVYGEGGAMLHLLNIEDTVIERTSALFALAQSRLPQINNIMFGLLLDTSDEIRLLTFNILDQQEDVIAKDINHIIVTLKTKDLNKERRAKLEKNLAMLYWELTYRHLILPELEESVLTKAQSYALSASKILKNDATLWALLGKIYEHLEQYSLAEEAFNKTMPFNIPPSQVLPYLAEIKFKLHDYIAVQRYLDESNTLSDIDFFAPVKRYWDKA